MSQLSKDKDVLLAIDANAIIHRAYHAYPESLSNSEGLPLNAVYGFTSMLLSVLSEFEPKYIVCAFDTGKPTFRHQAFPEYKAHRKPTDQSLKDQFPLVERVLKAFNIPILKKDTFEADDILGDLSEKSREGKWKDYGLNMVIVSGDKDLLQLVGENIFVTLPIGNFKNLILYDEEETFEKMGVKPSQIIDYKALVGDPSDNIPGVRGIGVKTAANLLSKYGTVDEIYMNLDKIGGRKATLLREGVEQMEMSRELATIVHDVGIDVGLEECIVADFDRSELLTLFQEFEFRSLINKLPNQDLQEESYGDQFDMFGGGDVSKSADSKSLNSIEDELNRVENLKLADLPARLQEIFKTDVVYIYYLRVGVEGRVGVIMFGVVDKSGQLLLHLLPLTRETAPVVSEGFTTWLPRETYTFGWEQLSEDLIGLLDEVEGYTLKVLGGRLFDLQLVSHMLSSGEKGKAFSDLTYKYLGKNYAEFSSVEDVNSAFLTLISLAGEIKKDFERRDLTSYSVKSLTKVRKEWKVSDGEGLVHELSKANASFQSNYFEFEAPLSLILGKMERRGVDLDVEKLEKLDKTLEKNVAKVIEQIYTDVGFEFNVNSPKQLSGVLFDDLGLPQGRGKSGRSTREDLLRKLEGLHPVISNVLEYREVSKIHNTYVKPLLENSTTIDEIDATRSADAVHTDYLQMGTSSGRLSSQDPNMQNLPARGDWAVKVKEVFVARKGYKLFSMDYSQIELRILADMSRDKTLVRDFKMGKDIHAATASRIVDKPLKSVTDRERRLGKTINFGIVYGQTKYGLSGMLGISVDDADHYISDYFKHYDGVKAYLDSVSQKVREDGYVETLLGRRRYLTGLDSSNRRVQDATMREAINMPIQGTAADIIKIAMVEIDKYITNTYQVGDVYMMLQVHDELIFEIKENLVESISVELEQIFSGIIELEVPLVVHTSIGDNLSQLK